MSNYRAIRLIIVIILFASFILPSSIFERASERTHVRTDDGSAVASAQARGPLTGKKIVVSGGHGLYNDETYGWTYQRELNYSGWGITEDIVDAEIAMHLCTYLERAGATVYSARELNKSAGNGVSGSPKWKEAAKYYIQSQGAPSWVYDDPNVTTEQNKDIRARPNYANWRGADLSISIHNNACESHNARGTSILYDISHSSLAATNAQLANTVHDKVYEVVRGHFDPAWPYRSVVETNNAYGEIRLCNMPSLIVECAFYDNYTDNQALHSEVFKMAVARGMFEGICAFFGVMPNGLYGAEIFIDAGHGLYNDETYGWTYQRSDYWGIIEDLLNDEIAAYLVPMLEMDGANVVCSRETNKSAGLGVSGYSKWREGTKYHAQAEGLPSSVWDDPGTTDEGTKDLYSRSNWANYIEPDLFVSLHNNANNGASSGTLTLWEQNTNYGTVHATKAQYAASRIHSRTLSDIRTNYLSSWVNQGCQETQSYLGSTLAVQRRTNAPAPLIEYAFFDKQSPDNDALHSEYFKMLCAHGTYMGICDYFIQYPVSDFVPEPKVEITSPKGFSIIGGTTKIAASYTSDSALAWSCLRVNGSVVAYDNSTPITYNLDTSAIAVGPKTINVTVCDEFGQTDSQLIYVNVRRNVALESGVWASSNELINDIDTTASYAATTWSADTPGSLTIALPSARYIDLVKTHLWDGDNRYYRYYIETSLDNSTWTRVADKTMGIHQSWQFDHIVPQLAKYVRITGTYNSANIWFHLTEMQVFALDAPDNIPPSSWFTSTVPSTMTSAQLWLMGDCSDTGGSGVARVEVNVNERGWQVAEPDYLHSDGTWDTWKFCFMPGEGGATTIRCRAIDRAGNVELPPHSTKMFTVNLPTSIPIESRGIWMDRWHVSTDYIDSLIQAAKDAHMNVVTLQILGEGYALYRSSILPRYPGIPAELDVLRYTLDKAHAENIEVHAWMNTLGVGVTNNASHYPAKHVIHDHNDWIAVDPNGNKDKGSSDTGGYGYVDLCPGRPEVKDYLVNVTMELAANYPDLDAIHLDYIRYSHANSSYVNERHCYCDVCKARYEEEYGYSGTWPTENTNEWCEFRRGLVTDIVKAIYENITSYNWRLKVGAAVWGNFSDGYNYYMQDSHKWMQMGIIDYVAPMMYSLSDSALEWTLSNPSYGHVPYSFGRHIYSGLGADTSGTPYHDPYAMPSQVNVSRNCGAQGSWMYDSETIVNDGTSYSSVLISSVFSAPANVPTMPWKRAFEPDGNAPMIAITSPQNGSEQASSFVVNGTAHDFYENANSTGISKVEYRLNQGAWNNAYNEDPSGKWRDFSFSCPAGVEGNNILEARATDVAGNSRIAALYFTRPSADSPPTIIQVSPANGTTNVPRETPVTIIFSKPVIAQSVAFTLELNGCAVEGAIAWNPTNTSFEFTPYDLLGYNSTYNIVVSSAADLAGHAMQGDFTSSFTTVSDTSLPYVVEVFPADGAEGVAVSTPIWVKFSEAMDNISSAFTLEYAPGYGEIAQSAWGENGTMLYLNPYSPLLPSTKYWLNLTSLFDRQGNLMVSRTFSFSTSALQDVTPPSVLSTVPANGSIGISVSERVILRFSEVMNMYSIEQALSISPVAGVDPSSWMQLGETITFRFSKPLEWNTTYRIYLGRVDGTGVMRYACDLSGNALPYFEFSFSTEVPKDGFFAGRTLDVEGMPIAGALVSILGNPIRCAGYALDCMTDNLGRYNITLPPGSYDARASKEGYDSSIEFGIVINPERTSSLHFVLAGPSVNASIAGFVRSENGTGIQGATIKLYVSGAKEPMKSAMTGSTGYYLFRDLQKGIYKLKAELAGYITKEMTITCDRTGTFDVDVTLVKGVNVVLGAIIGAVKDSDSGTPIRLATITLAGDMGRTALSDDFGRFGFDNLTLGNYSISISTKGYIIAQIPDITLTSSMNFVELPDVWLVKNTNNASNAFDLRLAFALAGIAACAVVIIFAVFLWQKRKER